MIWKRPNAVQRGRHLRKLARAALDAIAASGELDSKRPLGNSDIETDILEACGIKPAGEEDGWPVYTDDQEQYAAELWTEWPVWARRRLR